MSRPGKRWLFLIPPIVIPQSILTSDELYGEKYTLCQECFYGKIRPRRFKGDTYCMSHGLRESLDYYLKNGHLTPHEVEYVLHENALDDAKSLLGGDPTYVLPLQSGYIAIDEASQRIVISRKIISFSEIESYKILDKSIEFHVQSPNSTQYNVSTDKGLRRTIVGGVFAGPAGAVMGGLTANHSMVINEGEKSTYNTTEHDFDVLVKLKSFNHGGSVAIKIGNDEVKMQSVVNMIEKIMNR